MNRIRHGTTLEAHPETAASTDATHREPPGQPPGFAGPDRWTRFDRRSLWYLVMAVTIILAAIIAYAVTRSDGSDTTDTADTERIAELTDELVTASARLATLDADRIDLDRSIAELETELATATTGIDELTVERDSLLRERAELEDVLTAAESEVEVLEARLATMTTASATLDERIAVLDTQVALLLDRAITAERQRDALIDLFPIEFDSSLVGIDLRGAWDLDWEEAYCEGFATCGSTPAFGELTIGSTPEGWFRAEADGVFDAALFSVEGALYTITQSATAAPPCDGVRRLAHVGMTIYARGITIADDGTNRVDDLAATYVVEAPATADCPAGVAFYGAELTPIP